MEIAWTAWNRDVNGVVKVRLYKGNATIIGRKSSSNSLYLSDISTYSEEDKFYPEIQDF